MWTILTMRSVEQLGHFHLQNLSPCIRENEKCLFLALLDSVQSLFILFFGNSFLSALSFPVKLVRKGEPSSQFASSGFCYANSRSSSEFTIITNDTGGGYSFNFLTSVSHLDVSE